MILLAVEILCTYPVYVPHPNCEIPINCLDQQVVVVAHETIGKAEPFEPFERLLHDRQKGLPVLVVFKNRQAGVTLWR
jgi:hypothetical protein